MEITEVRIKLTSGKNEKLRAFCSITIDNDFVVRDLKVIEGAKGAFVAMPSRKLMARCSFCSGKNHYRAPYCNECGGRLSPERLSLDGRRKLHADVAHPINSSCRESIQQRVLAFYQEETERSKDPNYRPADIEDFDDVPFDEEREVAVGASAPIPAPRWGNERPAEESEPHSSSVDSERESDQASRASEENEWEETGIDSESGEKRASDPVVSSARVPGAAGDKQGDRVESSAGDARPSSADEPSSRRGGRSSQRSGGRHRRGRDPSREGASADRDRTRESSERGPSSEGVGGEKSPLAIEFDSLRPGYGLSGRSSSGRSSSSGLREVPRRDEATEPRIRERGGERHADVAKLRDPGQPKEGRIPEKLPIDEVDVEPEDNFGSGLFS